MGSRIHGMDESGVRLSYPPPLNTNMKYGHYSDSEIPNHKSHDHYNEQNGYVTNSFGYRCPEWTPMPDGKKNVVVLGCSHTFGEGLNEGEVWVEQLAAKTDQTRLRWWNLGRPGASADFIVRLLYATEKVLFPKIIVVCWPLSSRRERLLNFDKKPLHQINLTGGDPLLKYENDDTDHQNFLKNVFFVEKFAEHQGANVFHFFAEEVYQIKNTRHYVYAETTLSKCWPKWDERHITNAMREHIVIPSLAKDGKHYGIEHHCEFANKIYSRFNAKLR